MMQNRDMDIETQPADRDMPRGMQAQRGRGDVEEEMQLALPDIDMREVLPEPIDDQQMIEDVDSRVRDATIDADEPESLRMPAVRVEADLDDPGEVETELPSIDLNFSEGEL